MGFFEQFLGETIKHTAKYLKQQEDEKLRQERLKNSIVVECKRLD